MPLAQRFVDAQFELVTKLFQAYAAENENAQLAVYVGSKLVLVGPYLAHLNS